MNYFARILALLSDVTELKLHLNLMQNNTPFHRANQLIVALDQFIIIRICRPAISLNLNAIESP